MYILCIFKRKLLSILSIDKKYQIFQFLDPILKDYFFSFVFIFGYMFFPSYFAHVLFKSELIRKRALSNYTGFLGYQFFIFIISIICDCIIRFLLSTSFKFSGHGTPGGL